MLRCCLRKSLSQGDGQTIKLDKKYMRSNLARRTGLVSWGWGIFWAEPTPGHQSFSTLENACLQDSGKGRHDGSLFLFKLQALGSKF